MRPPPSPRNRHVERSRGQSATEFALVLPVAILMLLMAIDFGRVFLGWVNVNNMVRIGANEAALNPQAWQGAGDPALQARYYAQMANDATAIGCTLPSPLPPPTFPDPAPNTYALGGRAQVNLVCQFPLVTPLIGDIIGGSVSVGATAVFPIRHGVLGGIPVGVVVPTPSPTASASPTASPTATPTASPTPTATPTGSASSPPSPTPSPEPIFASFYCTPTSANSRGGGAPGSVGEQQIVGATTLTIQCTSTSTGAQASSCVWNFGDGTTTSNCSSVSHSFPIARGVTYTVSLALATAAGATSTATRADYVLVACQVPNFSDVHVDDAQGVWAAAGFTTTVTLSGNNNGNPKITQQSIAGGTLNPTNDCNSTITLSH